MQREGTAVSLQLEVIDQAGGPLTYGAANLPAGLTIDPVTGVIAGTLATGGAQTTTQPVAQAITYAIASGPAHGTLTGFDPRTGAVTYVPRTGFSGLDRFTFTVTDDTSAGGAALTSAPAAVDLVVLPTPGVPRSLEDGYFILKNQTRAVAATDGVLANDRDPEDHPLRAILTTAPRHGQLALAADGSFVYTPDAGFTGTDTFSYRAQDQTDGQTGEETFVKLEVQGEKKAQRFQFKPATIGEQIREIEAKYPPAARKAALDSLSERYGLDLTDQNVRARLDRTYSLAKEESVGGGAFVRFAFTNPVRFSSEHCTDSIIQLVKLTTTEISVDGKQRPDQKTFVEGWAVDANGVALGLDTHGTSGTQQLFVRQDQSVKIEIELTVGCGLYKNECITGERSPSPPGLKGVYDRFDPGNANDITWQGPTRTCRVLFFVDNQGNWVFGDESTGTLRAGRFDQG